MKIREYWKEIKRSILFIIIGGICGWLLLIGVYLLPTDPIEQNVKAVLEEFVELGPNPMLISDNRATRLDIYSDSVMLNEAIYGGNESIWEKSVGGYEYIYEEKTAFQSLLAYLSGEPGAQGREYARYWHGYLIFLKPLLTFFSYGDIKGINLLIQMVLIGVIIMEMVRRKMHTYIYAFILGIYSLMPIAISMCLEYSIVFNIMLVSCAVLLKNYERLIDKKLINLYYTAIGMTICYFDLLTYPLVALGFVLVMNIIMECSNRNIDILKIIRSILEKSLFWGCGYVGIWGIKWILASIFMRKNIIKEAVLFVLYRASTAASDSGVVEEISRVQALGLNIKTMINPVLIAIMGGGLCLIFFQLLKRRRRLLNIVQITGEIIVAVIPFIWVAFTANHAYIHYWMVYREFSITVFALASIMASVISNDRGIYRN